MPANVRRKSRCCDDHSNGQVWLACPLAASLYQVSFGKQYRALLFRYYRPLRHRLLHHLHHHVIAMQRTRFTRLARAHLLLPLAHGGSTGQRTANCCLVAAHFGFERPRFRKDSLVCHFDLGRHDALGRHGALGWHGACLRRERNEMKEGMVVK
jgi:hypothetical protein